MKENANWAEEIIQNNELLREQNDILRQLLCEQNAIFQQLVASPTTHAENDEREVFIDNINHDEMRDGFLVTSQRKKLWNVQIGMINEVARICKKHNIRWFADSGTLLGAARHKGFIPWDDDVDLIMFRPDYEKFKTVALMEIKEPYFFDNWYNYRLESEGASLNDSEGDFQFITEEQEKINENRWPTQWPSIRFRDSRTSMIEFPRRNFVNQGIWIDIFPLDPIPPFKNKNQIAKFEIAKTFMIATVFPHLIKKAIQNNEPLIIDNDKLKKFLALSYRERGKIFESILIKNFFMSECVGYFFISCHSPNIIQLKPEYFSDVIYLPFEKIEVPAPAGYDNVLKEYYGDWRKPVINQPHAQIFSTEISWREYFQKTAFK